MGKDTLHLPSKNAAGADAPSAVEVRLRCLEAAARNPDLRHAGGITAGVLDAADKYAAWVLRGEK